MWTIIVAGHVYLLNGQPVSMPDHQACQEFAERLGGQCEKDDDDRPREWVPPEVTPGMPVPQPVRK